MNDTSGSRFRYLDDGRAIAFAMVLASSAALWLLMFSGMERGLPEPIAVLLEAIGTRVDLPGPDSHAHASGMGSLAGLTVMWALMMAAMMLPAMAPVLASYARLVARETAGFQLALRLTLFIAGYLAVWGVVSFALAALQLLAAEMPGFSRAGTLAGPLAAAALMLVAGLYQLTPLKAACLTKCRHPLTFLLAHWREGNAGALALGLRHGVYCLGCCIGLMGLMFVLGAMNVWWMALLTIYFVAEKTLPHAERWGRAFGVVLIALAFAIAGGALAY